jgi:hypothetical protein
MELGEMRDAPQVRNATRVHTAIGVTVCSRMTRKPSWFSAGVGSSIQNSRYGSSDWPSRAASIGVSR